MAPRHVYLCAACLTALIFGTGYNGCNDNFIFGGNLPASRSSSSGSSSSGGSSGSFPVDDDGDGLSNEVEVTLGIDPRNADSDHDGFADGLEYVGRGGDPTNSRLTPIPSTRVSIVQGNVLTDKDSDSDGVPDREEKQLGLDSSSPDTDGDGYSDGLELIAGSDPNDSSSRPVRDAPLAPDGLTHTGNAPSDRDSDGISDVLEGQLGTNPGLKDTDGDGYPDGVEEIMGSDAKDRASIPDFTAPVTTVVDTETPQ